MHVHVLVVLEHERELGLGLGLEQEPVGLGPGLELELDVHGLVLEPFASFDVIEYTVHVQPCLLGQFASAPHHIFRMDK